MYCVILVHALQCFAGVHSGHLHFGLSQLLSTEGAEGGELLGGGGEPLPLRLKQQQQPRLASVLPQCTCQEDGGRMGVVRV